MQSMHGCDMHIVFGRIVYVFADISQDLEYNGDLKPWV